MLKKILMCLIAVALLAACDDKNDNELLYNLQANASGQVEFTWPNGGATVNGEATLFQCNDSKDRVLETFHPLREALETNSDPELQEAAYAVDQMFSVKGVAGQYKLKVKGYVRYGAFFFEIDEEYPKEVEEIAVEEIGSEVKVEE